MCTQILKLVQNHLSSISSHLEKKILKSGKVYAKEMDHNQIQCTLLAIFYLVKSVHNKKYQTNTNDNSYDYRVPSFPKVDSLDNAVDHWKTIH